MLLCQFLVLAGNRHFFVVAEKFYYDWKKKFKLSVWRVVLLCQFLVLAGNRFWLYILLCFEVPYSCGNVLVFLVLAENSLWCYVRT